MKTIFKKISALILCFVLICCSISANAATTGAMTPVSSAEANLKWTLKLGNSYRDAPSVPTIHGNYLYVMSGTTLYKINASSGKIIDESDMESEPSFGYTPVLVADNKVFCPLENGCIQAFDSDNLEPLWTFYDISGGQSLTSIVFSDEKIYTGFWNDEEENANFVCIDADSGNLKWSYTSKGGFYWSECFVNSKYVVVGGDNGSGAIDSEGTLKCFDKHNGNVIHTVRIKGDQRSGITMYNNNLYFVTKAGFLYKVHLNSNGKFENLESLKLSGASTSKPAIYNDRLYIGVQSSGFNGELAVIDANALELIYCVPMNGYPQSEVLISEAYMAETGKVHIYSSYNSYPGGITVITDGASQTTAQYNQLFEPEDDAQGYCISPVTVDSNGTLYYKNDSGSIFAIEKASSKNEDSFVKMIIKLILAVINLMLKVFKI